MRGADPIENRDGMHHWPGSGFCRARAMAAAAARIDEEDEEDPEDEEDEGIGADEARVAAS